MQFFVLNLFSIFFFELFFELFFFSIFNFFFIIFFYFVPTPRHKEHCALLVAFDNSSRR